MQKRLNLVPFRTDHDFQALASYAETRPPESSCATGTNRGLPPIYLTLAYD